MEIRPPVSCVVHALAAAPSFVGRTAELRQLRDMLTAETPGVLALVGLGGAGKTALAAAALAELLAGPPRYQGLLVWSFYQEPDAGRFLQEAYRYFGGQPTGQARGAGWLAFLRQALAGPGPYLLVLDGLERVQQPDGPAGNHGQIEDPLLRGLLTRIAEGMGRTTALVTSRFPLTDLHALENRGYFPMAVAGLDPLAASELLRRRGVQGSAADLGRLVEEYGAHALTLDHLGGLIGQFLGGDPRRAPEAPRHIDLKSDRQALQLARLLQAYEEHVAPAELALLSRLSIVRRNLTLEQILWLFACQPAVQLRETRLLTDADRHRAVAPSLGLPEVRDLLDTIQSTLEEIIVEEPIAGPAESFNRELAAVIQTSLDLEVRAHEQLQHSFIALDDLCRLYAGQALASPTDRLPLAGGDRELLQVMHGQYQELRQALGFETKDDWVLQNVWTKLGLQLPARPPREDDLFRVHQLRRRLNHLAIKHCTLVRVRELCRAHQQKWSLAGPLASLDAPGIRQVMDTLVERHLVLREADGSFSVHPAVKDHFGRLASTTETSAWHDVLRGQLISLMRKPGLRLPDDAASLDLIEEAIHHSQSAGRPGEAFALFNDLLGGLRHLAWKLGELTRGRRILRAFAPCPDRWALAWFERGLGELEEAYRLCEMPYFRADIRLLQGRLPEAAAEKDDGRAAVARFLMGEVRDKAPLPWPGMGCVIPLLQLQVLAGRYQDALHGAGMESLYQEMGWEGDRTRQLLLLADLACRQQDAAPARHHLEQATPWVLHSGSIEHLCLYHLVRARLARLTGLQVEEQAAGVRQALEHDLAEGLHLARQCGLELLLIDLLCLRAEVSSPLLAEESAREAWQRAMDPKCRFAWGAAHAGEILGHALARQKRPGEARATLEQVLALRRQLGDPKAKLTEEVLGRLPTTSAGDD